MLKKILIVLMIGCFLLGMATKEEVENVKEEQETSTTTTTVESAIETSAKIQLTTVYEKAFDEEIVDVIFDTATVTVAQATTMGWKAAAFGEAEKTRGTTEIIYPKVVFYGKEEWRRTRAVEGYINALKIVFYDENGNVKREMALGREADYYVSVSPNEKYIGVSKKFQEEGIKGKAAMLLDSEGNELLSFEKGQIIPPISDMGFVEYMPPVYFEGIVPIRIYDLNKRKVFDFETHDAPEIPNAEITGDVFVGEGRFLFSWVSGVKKSIGKLIDIQSGKILWKKEYDFVITGNWKAVSGKEGLGVFCSSKSGSSTIDMDIVALDWNSGEVLWSSQLDAPLATILIDTDNNIYVSSAFGYITSFTPEGKMRWYYEEPGKPVKDFYPRRSIELVHYTSVGFSKDQIVSRGRILEMIKGISNWKSSEILSLSKKDGRVIRKEGFSGKVMMSSKSRKLSIVTNDKVIKVLK